MTTEEMAALAAQGFTVNGQQTAAPTSTSLPAVPQIGDIELSMAKIQSMLQLQTQQIQINGAVLMKQIEAHLQIAALVPHASQAFSPHLGNLPWNFASGARMSRRYTNGPIEITEDVSFDFDQEARAKLVPDPILPKRQSRLKRNW